MCVHVCVCVCVWGGGGGTIQGILSGGSELVYNYKSKNLFCRFIICKLHTSTIPLIHFLCFHRFKFCQLLQNSVPQNMLNTVIKSLLQLDQCADQTIDHTN